MGILKNFESWALSDSNSSNSGSRSRGFEPWARPSRNDYTSPSTNPAQDVDDSSLYNPHSEYHNYDEDHDDIEEFDDVD